MKRLIFYVIILFLAVCLGLILKADPGYILIAYKKWTVETSLWFGIILTLVFIFIFYKIIKFFYLVSKTHGHLLRWYKQKKFIKAHSLTGSGLLALEEAEWQDAEELLLRGVESSTIPVVNYINAARSADKRQHYVDRNNYLEKALAIAEENELLAVHLLQVKFNLHDKKYEQASQLLEKLHHQHPKHQYILELLQRVYKLQEKWPELFDLLPKLNKRNVLDKEEAQILECLLYENLFKQKDKDIDDIKKLWRLTAKPLRHNTKIVYFYTKRLIKEGLVEEAEEIIADNLKKEFNVQLIELYGGLNKASPQKSLQKAQAWLQQYGESTELLTALAQIAISCEQLALAKSYAYRSLQLTENAKTYILLAAIEERLNNLPASQHAIAKAIEQIS
ncbi:MAG: hypothetical protein A3E87_09545 [Gammaproteobacteria bacterium RIFCSPHIGHO2_12_FULL_35_23]|nr:MAG: hypothetical protein A3E87_09545 [Gammaproteobacteria bacterium RIFCSPHIGHO2_12_FULL_35_23]